MSKAIKSKEIRWTSVKKRFDVDSSGWTAKYAKVQDVLAYFAIS